MVPVRLLLSIFGGGASALVALLLLSACSEEAVEVHTVPKGSETIAAEGAVTAGPAVPGAARADFTPIWSVPEGWREVGDAPAMRLTTFVFDGPSGGQVEVAVSRFPGDVGGLLANVNRWRGQMGLAPATEADLDELVERFSHTGFEGYTIHIEGAEQHMLAAGVFEAAQDRTWFVRVITDAATAAAVKDEVFAFARSFGAGGDA